MIFQGKFVLAAQCSAVCHQPCGVCCKNVVIAVPPRSGTKLSPSDVNCINRGKKQLIYINPWKRSVIKGHWNAGEPPHIRYKNKPPPSEVSAIMIRETTAKSQFKLVL